ncbi:hypothetical protein Sme01_16370 [Sphaerisporangium melleum]|uniref:Uncharacterized protein n=1 Tax=Sphaerisporangium melleum TaxID=321316 RepID=A0A917VUD9_9ACTN|nr:hypothetical protein [Sphaerisporangium melleum]GGL15082.1 hypothetical protein GCM10007964_66350 [Sphaerisporangium melleum]GII69161.1 hypothetical protein Sme01_16370 [Sphaerisporangium melleum]
MTDSPDEYGEVLRRVLRAEADSVVPSAEGLQIIRTRIEQRAERGIRGIFWWRAAASAFGAVLVAATVVMVVPGLREQFDPGREQQVIPVQYDTDPPDESSTRRPPATGPSAPAVVSRKPHASPSPSTTLSMLPTPSVSASPGNDCATTVPTAVEPEPGSTPQPCAEPTGEESQPDQTTEPGPRPTHQSGTPTPTATAQPSASPRPTAQPSAPETPQPPASTPPAAPSATPQMTTEGDSAAVPTASQQ